MAHTLTLAEQVAARDWYHTLELAPGVTTAGWFDLRSLPMRLPLPASLAGRRCLDVGTFDGFWAFMLESRGAAEVRAIDVLDPERWDWPASATGAVQEAIGARKGRGEGFELARGALGSRVVREERSVYELDPSHDGTYDFVFMGSLLLHLRDPIGALQRVRAVCRGELLVLDAIDPALSVLRRPLARLDARGRPWWWKPNVAAVLRMLEAAGFASVSRPQRVWMPAGRGMPRPAPRALPRVVRSAAGRELLWMHLRGDPHVAVLAR
jgi:tRNA (mo5U34)-methyltransferase